MFVIEDRDLALRAGLPLDSKGEPRPLFDESAIRGLLIDIFDQVGYRNSELFPENRTMTLDNLLNAVEEQVEYLVEEHKWNQEHGLTAKCPECSRAMNPDKTWCSHRCYRAYKEMLRDNGITDPTSHEATRLIVKEHR